MSHHVQRLYPMDGVRLSPHLPPSFSVDITNIGESEIQMSVYSNLLPVVTHPGGGKMSQLAKAHRS
jgi:hypothetical protein